MRPVTRSELVTRVRRRCKMESSQFVSDEELRSLVTESVAELYDLLIGARGQEYYRTTAECLTVSGRSHYFLPGDFYQLLGVYIAPGSRMVTSDPDVPEGALTRILTPEDVPGGEWYALRPFMMRELGRGWSGSGSCREVRYRLGGTQETRITHLSETLELRPLPSGQHTLRVVYVPHCNRDAIDQEGQEPSWDGINGFEEYVVLSVSMQVLGMEESGTSHLATALARIAARIESLADARDAGHAERIIDRSESERRAWWRR